MSEPVKPPVLQKPPGYRDPNRPVQPAPRPQIRKPVLPPSFHPKRKRRSCCRICCCFLCALIFLLLFLALISGGLFYLWFDPKLPVFHLQSFKIHRFNVTVKSDGTYLDTQAVVRVEVKNRNSKLKVIYDGTHLRVSVGQGDSETELGSESLGSMTQGKKNVTSLRVETRVKNLLVDDETGAKLKREYKNRALVVFVEVKTRIGLGWEGWRVGMGGVKVLCGGVSLKEIDGGAMPKCKINLLKWINIH